MLNPQVRRVGRYVLKGSHPLWLANFALAKRFRLFKPLVVHLAQEGWVLDEVRKALCGPLSKHYSFMPPFAAKYLWSEVRRSIVHFGTAGGYTELCQYLRIHSSNRQVLTWTHGQRSNPDPIFAKRLDEIGAASIHADKIISISKVGADVLTSEGVERNKVVYIPLGIDTETFTAPSPMQRSAMRRQLGIPDDAFCIGSFQKDGEGWDGGMTPKWVKGPDVFLEVVDRLRRDYELCILLTGPSRGFVKSGLDRMGVTYRHVWLRDYQEVASYYWALDLYVIASRDEGGPMAVLESMASGVPLVSTRVGMSIDLICDGGNGFLNEVEDSDGLAASASKILEWPSLQHTLSRNGVLTASSYDWATIAAKHDEQVYRPLLIEDGYVFTD